MSREPTDVLIGAYYTTEPAKQDYQAVIDAGVKIDGAVCVSRDHAGELHVEETDHMARKGHSGVKSKIEKQAFDAIPYGGAGLIVAYPRSSADGIDQAVTRALKKAVGEADGKKVEALKKAMAEAQTKMQQPA